MRPGVDANTTTKQHKPNYSDILNLEEFLMIVKIVFQTTNKTKITVKTSLTISMLF
jgi:hypothetical protein